MGKKIEFSFSVGFPIENLCCFFSLGFPMEISFTLPPAKIVQIFPRNGGLEAIDFPRGTPAVSVLETTRAAIIS